MLAIVILFFAFFYQKNVPIPLDPVDQDNLPDFF